MSLSRLLRISRPRFWLYELGTFAVGLACAYHTGVEISEIISLVTIVFFLYFLFPANLLIYGINDIHDYESDRLNPKKGGYEALVTPPEHRQLYFAIILTTLPFLLLLWGIPPVALVWFGVFLLCAIGYSAPPLRAKARPFFDSAFSAGHYVATGVFAFYLAGASMPSMSYVAAGFLWAVAMHAYSAAPDIQADTESSTHTIATQLGASNTLALCAVLYASAAVLAAPALGALAFALGTVYVALVAATLVARKDNRFTLYTLFPYVNAVSGALLFWYVLLF